MKSSFDSKPIDKDMKDGGSCVIFHGTRDKLICGCYARNPWLLSGRVPNAPKRVREVPDNNHYQDWIRACKLLWDAENMKFTNISDTDKLSLTISDDFTIFEDGYSIKPMKKLWQNHLLKS